MPELKPIGSSGMTTPRLVLGGNVFGDTSRSEEAFRLLDRFVEAGGTMIDTADVYSNWVPGHVGGESENLLGEWLKRRGRREDVLIATKVGWEVGLSAKSIVEGIDGSLGRLGTDYVDLYYAHRDDPTRPVHEPLQVFDRLVREGKVRTVGASNFTAERLVEAPDLSSREGLVGYTVMQPEYSLMARSRYEGELQQSCIDRGLGVLAHSSLASGFLTGKYRAAGDFGKSTRGRKMGRYLNNRGLRVLAALDDVAAQMSATPAQVALAWVAARPGVTAPIASATSLAQLEELLAVLTLELTARQVDLLSTASVEEEIDAVA